VRIVKDHFSRNALPTERLLFPGVTLKEPAKADALLFLDAHGPMPPRRARVEAMHYPSNRLWVATVDLGLAIVQALELQAPGTQSFVTASEFAAADAVVHAHGAFKSAMRLRGLDPDLCYLDVWAPGDVPGSGALSHGAGTRILRVIAYYRGPSGPAGRLAPNPYDRPVEGVVVTLDMNSETIIGGQSVQGRVVDLLDTGVRPTASESGNSEQVRAALNPLNIQEPQGPNYSRTLNEGRQIHWQEWDFYAVLCPREGLVLYDVRFRGRRVLYRAALSEAYVPYGLGDVNWIWRSAFDFGEYWPGTFAQKLELDKDVPNNATLMNAVFATDAGGTATYKDVLGIYEKFNGFAWTRTDPSTGARDTRAGRALVLHWNTWIGNYIYGFDWVLSQDGSLEVVLIATGTTVNRGTATDAGEGVVDNAAPLVAIGPRVEGSATGASPDGKARVRAPNHQHFFNFRFDFDIDGQNNVAIVKDIAHVPAAEAGGAANVFEATEAPVLAEGGLAANPLTARTFGVRSASARNALGDAPAYEVELPYLAFPLSEAAFAPLQRAVFATKQFWVTRYRDGELYAAGDFPNQGAAGAGLPSYVTDNDPLDGSGAGADIVTWLTLGFTHNPRPEDYPVMSAERISFRIPPHGFLAKNPALDLAN